MRLLVVDRVGKRDLEGFAAVLAALEGWRPPWCNPGMTSARARHAGVAVLAAVVILATSSAVDAALASGCTPRATRAAVTSFVAAFNRGDGQKLDGLFARSPLFQWYSSNVPGPRRTAAAGDRGSLIDYFRSRHAKRDRLRLVSFSFTGNSPGYGNFVFKLKRSAADYRRGT